MLSLQHPHYTHSLTLHQPDLLVPIIISILFCLILSPSGINSQNTLFFGASLNSLSFTYVSINNFDHLVLDVFRYLFKCNNITIICKCIHIAIYTIFRVLCTKLLNFYLSVIILISGFTVLLALVFAKCATHYIWNSINTIRMMPAWYIVLANVIQALVCSHLWTT